jgi:hypothetical protein
MSANEIAHIRQELVRLRAEIMKRPTRISPVGGNALKTITITGGNTLASGQAGIKASASEITSVPSAYDPNVDTSFIDGIGRGTLRINGTLQTGSFLVVNDTNSPIARALVQSDVIAVWNTVSIAVSGDPNGATVTAYVPLFF